MVIRARFECKSVKQVLPKGTEKVRYEIVLQAKDICEGDNENWSPNADPEGIILLTVTDKDRAQQFEPGKRYALCMAGCDKQGTWRFLLDRICNLRKSRQESSSAWSRFILWLMPVGPFAGYIWTVNGLPVL